MPHQGLYYLALPYHGTDKEKAERTALSLELTTTFLKQGVPLFSPILYVNKIAENLGFPSLEERRKVIMPYLFEFLKLSRGMLLVTAKGWEKSWGIHQELLFCNEQRIPLFQMSPGDAPEDIIAHLSSPLDQKGVQNLISQYA